MVSMHKKEQRQYLVQAVLVAHATVVLFLHSRFPPKQTHGTLRPTPDKPRIKDLGTSTNAQAKDVLFYTKIYWSKVYLESGDYIQIGALSLISRKKRQK